MFILITTKNCHLKHVALPNHTCPHCGFKGGLELDIWKATIGAFYIPMMPSLRPKTLELSCSSCNAIIPKKAWPEACLDTIHQAKKTARLPNRYRFGFLYLVGAMALIFAIALGYGMATRGPRLRQEQALAQNMAHPQVGQIMAYSIEEIGPRSVGISGYGFGSIERIEGDAIWVKPYDHPLTNAQFSDWMDKKYDVKRMTGAVVVFKLKNLTHGGRLFLRDTPDPKPGEPAPAAWGTAHSIFSAR